MLTFRDYLIKENIQINDSIMLSEDASNKLGASDQLSKFWSQLSTMMNSKQAATADVAVDVYEYHWDTAPKKIVSVRIDDFSHNGFTAELQGLGVVKFGKSGRAMDTNLDLFALAPRFVAKK